MSLSTCKTFLRGKVKGRLCEATLESRSNGKVGKTMTVGRMSLSWRRCRIDSQQICWDCKVRDIKRDWIVLGLFSFE